MRVISGSARGRNLRAVPGMSTRPTSDKVKEALFSMLGPYFTEGRVLDLFAGTGSLGIEALSRGMTHAVFIDQDSKAIETIHHNLQSIGFSDCSEIYRNDALRALKVLAKRQQTFQLIFLDPPYRMREIPKIIQIIQALKLVTLETRIVVEHEASYELPKLIGVFQQIRAANYGDTAISIYDSHSFSRGGEVSG